MKTLMTAISALTIGFAAPLAAQSVTGQVDTEAQIGTEAEIAGTELGAESSAELGAETGTELETDTGLSGDVSGTVSGMTDTSTGAMSGETALDPEIFAEGKTVTTADGATTVGVVDQIFTDAEGVARVMVSLDDAFATEAKKAAFRAEVLTEGEAGLMLDMDEAELLAALAAGAGAGAEGEAVVETEAEG